MAHRYDRWLPNDPYPDVSVLVVGDWHAAHITAACLAISHRVVMTREPSLDVREPELDELLTEARSQDVLTVASPDNPPEVDIVWIAIDTPCDGDGRPDPKPVIDAAVQYAPKSRDKLVIVSSQVPIGTCDKIASLLGDEYDVAHVPENMRLGDGINGFLKPDRLVIGAKRPEVRRYLWADFLAGIGGQTVLTNLATAEMIKHATNMYLATDIAIANELAWLGLVYGVEPAQLAAGLRADKRIGPHAYVMPGQPFGGGTLLRDLRALAIRHAKTTQPHPEELCDLPEHIIRSNEYAHSRVTDQIAVALRQLPPLPVVLLGATHKPGSTKDSWPLRLAASLEKSGARVMVCDASCPSPRRSDDSPFETCSWPPRTKPAAIVVAASPKPSDFGLPDWDSFWAACPPSHVLDMCNLYASARDAAIIKAGHNYRALWREHLSRA